MKPADLNILIAAYGVPGVFAIETLFSLGIPRENISLITYPCDKRNTHLIDFASSQDIPTSQDHIQSDEAKEWITDNGADILFSFHYRDKIPSSILDTLEYGGINLHPSLLPAYRGCFSIPWALIQGERFSGFTYHYMSDNFDEGNILLQKRIRIRNNDTAFSLFHRQITEGLKWFPKVFRQVVILKDHGTPQPPGGSYFPRKVPFDGKINPQWDIVMINRFVRAMYFPPHPGAIFEDGKHSHEINSVNEIPQILKKREFKR